MCDEDKLRQLITAGIEWFNEQPGMISEQDLVLAILVSAALAFSWGAAFGICSRAKLPRWRKWLVASTAWLLAFWWIVK